MKEASTPDQGREPGGSKQPEQQQRRKDTQSDEPRDSSERSARRERCPESDEEMKEASTPDRRKEPGGSKQPAQQQRQKDVQRDEQRDSSERSGAHATGEPTALPHSNRKDRLDQRVQQTTGGWIQETSESAQGTPEQSRQKNKGLEGGDGLEALRSQGATPAGQRDKLRGKEAEDNPQAATLGLEDLRLEDLRSAKLLSSQPFDLRSQDRITRDAKREMEEIWDVSMEEPQRGLIGKKRARLRKKIRVASNAAETGQETSASEAEAAKRPKAVMDKPLLPTPLGEVEPELGTAGPALGETASKPATAWANPLVLSSSTSLSLSPTLPPPGPLGESNAVAQIQVDDMELMEYQRLQEEQEKPGLIQREEEQRAFDDIHVRRMLLLDVKFDELREQGRLRVVPLVLRLTEIKLQILLSPGQATDRPPKIPFIKFAGHPSMQKAIVTAERWLGGAYEVLPMKGVSAIRLRLKSDSGESLGAYCFMLRAEPRPQANHEEDPHFSWTDLEPLILELPDPEENSTVQDDTTTILALLNQRLPENKRFTHRTFITDPETWLRDPRHGGRQTGRIPVILHHGCASTHRLRRKTTKN
ncbi:hypothetical protein CBR_g49319 [Chara braunii]|uniref:Uncharacterized protein n=1 Tax=Chara braunii TaxID=69332 RepID=A0A388M4X8_CHABU|nr:hypothetical protein CBR_g49319 [Chara braunii]|eukprot:GBG89529.1 hypothetical protein CBR_g49319 [Chara braunii]